MKKAISILTAMAMLVLMNPVNVNASQNKAPDFVKGQLSKQLTKDMKGVHTFFHENKSIFHIEDAENELTELKSQDDKLGFKHIKTQQMVNGIPVFGNEYIVHFNKSGQVYAVNGKYDPAATAAKFNKRDFIKESKALEIAKAQVTYDELDKDAKTKLYLYNINNEYIPVYLVSLSFLSPKPGNWQFFINAETGVIVHSLNKLADIATTGTGTGVLGDTKTLNLNTATVKGKTQYQMTDNTRGVAITTYSCSNTTRTPGSIVYSSTNVVNDKAAVDAHAYAGTVYDYYKAKFNRNSIDGAGMAIKSSVHYKQNYVNAFWNGSQMIYGDGNGVDSLALSGGLDVIGHEMTHGVDENEANLVYENQSGALNESYSDVFGTFIESYAQPTKFDWLIGEDIWTPAIAGDALRSMSNPAAYGDPDHMSKYVNSPNTSAGDWGGVHTNSGIPNKACYLTTSNANMGVAKAEQIYYRALTTYLTSTSNFHDARVALAQSAADLYGANGAEVTAVNNAWDAVGVY